MFYCELVCDANSTYWDVVDEICACFDGYSFFTSPYFYNPSVCKMDCTYQEKYVVKNNTCFPCPLN
jgi:hypothetical protein